ncbi:hypothetical protein KOR42_39710 [Thalassoglobus neptunius]|uniref:Phage integrase family protein n=1 Tax=Thalassoglobus neptunius TaxID=1938619 RepID=A0A5C5WG23_9PLAN|nr:hypothetical protein [Thalassoglobus neptunius]TWT49055.1 hypothetical protein KOR42_39710 [Thalassoglobus neptunius]
MTNTTDAIIKLYPQTQEQNEVDQAWQSWNSEQASEYCPRHVPPEEREHYARTTSLRQFYTDCLDGKWEAIGKKGRCKGTAAKDRQSLNRWERYSRPADWVGHWPGPSLALIDSGGGLLLERVFDAMLDSDRLSPNTVKSTRNHLMTIIRHAVEVKAISNIPRSEPIPTSSKTRIYTREEVTRILEALENLPSLRAAFLISLNVGARPVDLFCLKKSDLTRDLKRRRLIEFESRKTGKLQGVPISDETWKVIQPFAESGDSPYLFPDLGSPEALDPEKTSRARSRNQLLKLILRQVGITDISDTSGKPWQVARATCNERYESHAPGVGPFILGHSLSGVNARSYRDPTEAVHSAVNTLPPYVVGDRQRTLF